MFPCYHKRVGGCPLIEGCEPSKGGEAMELMDLIAVIGFAVTVFIAGYNIGKK